jgi:hypothetical protein
MGGTPQTNILTVRRRKTKSARAIRAVVGAGRPEHAMPLEMERRHLELANRHIAEGRERIVAQRARVALMERGGHDTGRARDLLRHFESTLEQMLKHRELILREIDRLQQQP